MNFTTSRRQRGAFAWDRSGRWNWLHGMASGCGALLLLSLIAQAWAGTGPSLSTDIAAVRRLAFSPQNAVCSFRLAGLVLWVDRVAGRLVLQGDSATLELKLDLARHPKAAVGQQVLVEGTGIAGGGRLRAVLLDNDGLHPETERTETVFLPAGLQPLSLEWFNGPSTFALRLEYAGPGLPRQRIPSEALFQPRADGAGGGPSPPGLEYRSYEGVWEFLPDFQQLLPIKSGVCTNFDLGLRTRDQHVALKFDGQLEVPQEGAYTFWLRSDDGSRLWLGGAGFRLTCSGPGSLPKARRIAPGADPGSDECWVEVQGILTAIHGCGSGGLEAEVSSDTNHVWLEVADASGRPPALFSRVRATGLCRRPQASRRGVVGSRVLLGGLGQIETLAQPEFTLANRAVQVRDLLSQRAYGRQMLRPVRLEGLVLASNPRAGLLVLQDDSGAALLRCEGDQPSARPGTRIALEGLCALESTGLRLVRNPALVDNDGTHTMTEQAGTIYLREGKYPLHVSWFNRGLPAGLELAYEGPGIARQRVPAAALSRMAVGADGRVQWSPGLQYRAYEGNWEHLPDPALLEPAGEGQAAGLDIGVATRATNVVLEFSGFIQIPREGQYTFWTRSDDGSRLWVGETWPTVEVLGTNALPAPVRLTARQSLREDQALEWSEVEGAVSFVSRRGEGLELELTSGSGRMQVEVLEAAASSPLLLLNSRIRVRGLPELSYTADGQRAATALVTPGLRELELVEPATSWADYPLQPVHALTEAEYPEKAETLVRARGKLRAGRGSEGLMLEDESGHVQVELAQPPPPVGELVEVLGRWRRAGSNVVLQCACYRSVSAASPAGRKSLPALTLIEQVKSLSRDEAQRGYPVHIRGIITTVLDGGVFIQDSTWAIYARWTGTNVAEVLLSTPPKVGDYWELEGVTFAEFAPNVRVTNARRLGEGTLPEPLRPAWDQLINGSLDTLYVEVQGVVTGTDSDALSLYTRTGKLKVQLTDAEPALFKRYENALIRVRGCVIPGRNATTQEVQLGHIRLSTYSITVDEPAPADPFAATPKRVSELLLFDPRAGAIQRVKIAGQIVHAGLEEFFLMEHASGLRFFPKAPGGLRPGDLVEVVGFPELGGPSPVLREAVVRRTGHAALPTPRSLAGGALLSRQYDSTLVRLEARLSQVSVEGGHPLLELQAGTRVFLARLPGKVIGGATLLPGSLLELSGVYASKGGERASGRELDSFELLLNSAADIHILHQPSWWTVRHTLTVAGVLALVLMAAAVWITLLRRQVEERSRQLAAALQRHEMAERQRAVESERTRIARDLHDDLGASLTQIRFLSAVESRDQQVPEMTRSRMSEVSEKLRQMVASLDEIVWAVNPANDSLPHLATYLCQFAEEFFRATPVRCRLDVPESLPPLRVSSEVRHHLYLAVREALNNIAKHAQATEVWLRIQYAERELQLALEDNGRGFANSAAGAGGDGLVNMRRRLEGLGGRFACDTRPTAGTTCRIWLPLE